ncbi:tetratricopeptide repeat protein [Streptomyces hesseae]|uniref:Tetratricopeptide repeat protein n=1 Tax=Streptomyces hesseae TaxID=3075519 RepID=A0ABU2SGX2_9ACTN|nr:tetratricopeptide repeat protein [Streptomyces sp. DSM 40473]MDT0448168.1 tetratricopeptide repeat protein [Streptomyces sp. DSM 40473]
MSTGTTELKERALALMEVDRFEQAAELLARYLADAPADAWAWAWLAHCRFRSGDREGALKAADEGIAADPACWYAWERRSFLLPFLLRLDDALEAAREAVRVGPEVAETHAVLARCLLLAGDREGRYAAQLKTVELAPDSAVAHFNLASAAGDVGRADIRVDALRTALRLDPDFADARAQLADIRADAREIKLPELAGEYAAALGTEPDARHLEHRLQLIVLRLLRRTRWFALAALVIAAQASRAFPTGDAPTELPVPLGIRLWALVLMGVLWVLGGWFLAYRKLPRGARSTVWSLLRLRWSARLPVAHALWGTLCAVALVAVPWTDRTYERTLALAGAVPVVLAMWYGAAQRREERERAAKSARSAGADPASRP